MDSVKIKTSELRKLNLAEMHSRLEEIKTLHASARLSNNTGKSIEIRKLRRQIAQMKLVISQKMIHEQRILYKNAKHVPLDLRPKKTHALRLKLKKEQRMKKTLRQKKRSIHFPKRIYAIKQSE